MDNFDKNPFIVIWEVTRSCSLKCLHCRADAQHQRDPRELSTEEGKHLLREIKDMGNPLFVFTGGDPLMREDLFKLAAYAKDIGLRVSITPSATPRVTTSAMKKAVEIGFHRWAFSLDGSSKEIHDAFRGTNGSFDLTVRSLRTLRELGMPVQINTTVSRHNVKDLPSIVELITNLGVAIWSVFFLVPTGRGKTDDMLSPHEHEEVLEYLSALTRQVPFDIKTTEAPNYRRVLLQKYGTLQTPQSASVVRSTRGITDGNGFVFISHTGDVHPSGFLPLNCGNVRQQPLADIYRDHPTFQTLRRPNQFKGKCGVCEFNQICGGSRARAYATTGDPFESDPSCVYIPPAWKEQVVSV